MSQSEFWIAALDRESESARTIGRTLEQAGYPEPCYFADPAGILTRIETFVPPLVIVNLDLADLAFMSFAENDEFLYFTEPTDDPGEILHRKVLAVLANPPKYDHQGREFREPLTYRDALDFVSEANPELAEKYFQSIRA